MLKTPFLLCAAILLVLEVNRAPGQTPASGYPAALSGGRYMHNFYFPPPATSTPWAPDWAPDGRSIAVSMNGSIWNVDPDSGQVREITYSEKYHSSPDWSPDGRWLVYTADDGGNSIQLEILNSETGESHALTDDGHIYTDPVFSPDGRRIAYVSTKPNGYFNVYVRSIENGRWSGEEIPITKDNKDTDNRLYFGEWDMHITPAWLPNGNELLLVSNRNVPLGSGNVLRVPVERHAIAEARTVLQEQTLYRARPDVSLDGKRFAYSSTRGAADQFSNLYVQPTIGGEPYKLTFHNHDAFHPRWSPDGEWIAYISNGGGLPRLALLETYGGKQKTVTIEERTWKRPVGRLSVRIRRQGGDEMTGARVYLTAADGKFYAPQDTYARFSGEGDMMFHTTGTFDLDLPVGTVDLLVVKGFEYEPLSIQATIAENRATSLDVALEPIADLSAEGWYSGSTHVHMNYGGNLGNSLENLIRMSEAEDQDIVLEQIANKDNRILDYQFFVPGGNAHPLSTEERLLVVGQEYRPPFYGHVFLFGMKEHLISPFTTGYAGTAIESLYPSNTDMFRKAKRQGAWTGYVHAFNGDLDPLRLNLGGAKGFMVDAALGTTDAVEWSNANRAGFYPLYAVWNNGLKIAACGGEDSISDLHWSKLIGSLRTYVHTGEAGLQMNAWFDGLRDGNAFVSNGPLIDFEVAGKRPGENVELSRSGETVEIEASVSSIVPLKKLLLIHNGNVIDERTFVGDRRHLSLSEQIPVNDSGWFHLRVEGDPAERFPLDGAFAQAFTNPVWIHVGDRPIRNRSAAEYSIQWIDKLKQFAEAWPGWRSQKERDHVFGQFDEARRIYQQLAAEDED